MERKEIKNFLDFKNIRQLFLENRSLKQTVFKNTFWLATAQILSRLLTFFLFVYVARVLGPEEYGKIAFGLSFILLASIFSDFGLSQIVTREFSREKEAEKEYPALLSLKGVLFFISFGIIIIGSFFITSNPALRTIIWILAAYVTVNSFSQLIYALFEARQRMEYEAFAQIFQAVLFTAIGFFVIFNFPSAKNFAYGYLVGTIIFLTFLFPFFHFRLYPLFLKLDKNLWVKYLRMSWPLAFAGLFATIHNQIDTVMMGYLNQITEAGWYNAASRIARFAVTPIGLISTSFFPPLSIAFKESAEKLQRIWDHLIEIVIFLAIPLMVGGVFLGKRIIEFVYDKSYTPSILAFQILILTSGVIFVFTPFVKLLIAANQQKKILFVGIVGALINIILNLLLIPKYSLYGAAFATVITYFIMFLLVFVFTSRNTQIKPFDTKIFWSLIGIILSSGLMILTISYSPIYNFPILYLIAVGAIVYCIYFYFYKKLWNFIFS